MKLLPVPLCPGYRITNQEVRQLGFTPHIRHRGEDAKAYLNPGRPARRWVIERTNSWINRFRRILIRWEKKAENYLGFLDFAMALIVYNKLSRANALFR